MYFQTLSSPVLKVPRVVLLSCVLWWELGTNLPGHGPDEWLSFWRVTSKHFWFWNIFDFWLTVSAETASVISPFQVAIVLGKKENFSPPIFGRWYWKGWDLVLLLSPASDMYLFLSIVTRLLCILKRPAVSDPRVLATGAPPAFLQRDSGYASVTGPASSCLLNFLYSDNFCLLMGVPYRCCIL